MMKGGALDEIRDESSKLLDGDIFAGLPEHIGTIFAYVRRLGYADSPDYSFIIDQMRQGINNAVEQDPLPPTASAFDFSPTVMMP